MEVNEAASVPTATCQLRFRDGRLPLVQNLAQHILDIRIGARLRGMEAVVDGNVERRGRDLVFITPAADQPIFLSSLKTKVQVRFDIRKRRNRKDPPTAQERDAYRRLLAEFERAKIGPGTLPVRVTGPVMESASSGQRTLNVRDFQWDPPALKESDFREIRCCALLEENRPGVLLADTVGVAVMIEVGGDSLLREGNHARTLDSVASAMRAHGVAEYQRVSSRPRHGPLHRVSATCQAVSAGSGGNVTAGVDRAEARAATWWNRCT